MNQKNRSTAGFGTAVCLLLANPVRWWVERINLASTRDNQTCNANACGFTFGASRHHWIPVLRKGPWPKGLKVCIFANGCFWGSEKGIWRLPGGGIFSTAVGYAGGYTPNPTYEDRVSAHSVLLLWWFHMFFLLNQTMGDQQLPSGNLT